MSAVTRAVPAVARCFHLGAHPFRVANAHAMGLVHDSLDVTHVRRPLASAAVLHRIHSAVPIACERISAMRAGASRHAAATTICSVTMPRASRPPRDGRGSARFSDAYGAR